MTARRLAVLAFAAALAVPTAPARAQQGIAAVVNEEVVTLRDLDDRIDLIVASGGLPEDDETRERLAPQVARGLVDETLQLQEARRLGITVTPAEVDRGVDLIARQNNTTGPKLAAFLERNDINVATLRGQIRAQIAWLRVVGRTLRPRVSITEAQVRSATRAYEEGQGRPEYFLREIVLPSSGPNALGDASRLARTVRGGTNFAEVARQVSTSANAGQGGALGWVRETELPDDIRPTVEGLEIGEVSEPVRTPAGLVLLLVEARRIAGVEKIDYAGVQVRLAQLLLPASQGSDAEAQRLIAQANGLRPRLDDCADVGQTAEALEAPASGDLGWLAATDLPPALGEAVATLPVNEISRPVRGPAGVHLLMVCSRRGEPVYTRARVDPARIRRQLEGQQIDSLAGRYLRDLRDRAFVDLRV